MLIFDNWLNKKYNLNIEDVLINNEYTKYVDEYYDYEKSFVLTKTFEDALSFLKEHPAFQNQFDKCIYMLGEDEEHSLILEVDMFILDKESNRYIKAHVIDFDVYGSNYQNAIIKLAHKVEANYNYERD